MRRRTDGQADSKTEIALLDVDTCRERSPRDRAAHMRNLRRFLRSWDKWNAREGPRLTGEDRRAFLAAYDPKLMQ